MAIAIFGILILFGKGKPEQFYKFVIFLIFAPVLLAIGFNHTLWLWYGLPFWIQILSLLLLPLLLLLVLRTLFPKSLFVRVITDVLWDTVVFAFTFPIRLIFRSGRLISQRERTRTRLAPHQTVIGRRPPLSQPRRRVGRFDDED